YSPLKGGPGRREGEDTDPRLQAEHSLPSDEHDQSKGNGGGNQRTDEDPDRDKGGGIGKEVGTTEKKRREADRGGGAGRRREGQDQDRDRSDPGERPKFAESGGDKVCGSRCQRAEADPERASS